MNRLPAGAPDTGGARLCRRPGGSGFGNRRHRRYGRRCPGRRRGDGVAANDRAEENKPVDKLGLIAGEASGRHGSPGMGDDR
ncbi:MAG TPA: hypothetical protein PKV70_07470, partial [Thermodesulfobacteriota bacterium]|nr:hypothetical protein [Thermodesulfobacteriota bacterium]